MVLMAAYHRRLQALEKALGPRGDVILSVCVKRDTSGASVARTFPAKRPQLSSDVITYSSVSTTGESESTTFITLPGDVWDRINIPQIESYFRISTDGRRVTHWFEDFPSVEPRPGDEPWQPPPRTSDDECQRVFTAVMAALRPEQRNLVMKAGSLAIQHETGDGESPP